MWIKPENDVMIAVTPMSLPMLATLSEAIEGLCMGVSRPEANVWFARSKLDASDIQQRLEAYAPSGTAIVVIDRGWRLSA